MLARHRSFRPPAPVSYPHTPGSLDLVRILWSNPIEAWTKAHFEEPIVCTRLPFGDVVAVNDPAAVRRVLQENEANYCKDRFQKRMLAALSGGLLTAEDEYWYSQRRLIAPLFRPSMIKDMAPAMVAAIDELVGRWTGRDRCVLDVAEETTDLALDVLERTIFSAGLFVGRDDLRAAMRTYFDGLGRIDPFDLLDLPDFIPRISPPIRASCYPGVSRCRGGHDSSTGTRAREARNKDGKRYPDAAHSRTGPDTGRKLTRQEIRANVITFMAAGHESTANAITWTLYLLSRSPEWRESGRAEAVQVGAETPALLFDRLSKTRAVVEEALRLYPPLAAIGRMARSRDELAGMRVEAGAIVVIAPYVLHRHKMWGPRADEFDPARFLSGSREYIDRYTYLPFGAGARGCIGSIFALREATLAVAAITRNFELEVKPRHIVWPVHRITLRPRGGLPMLVRGRTPGRPPVESNDVVSV